MALAHVKIIGIGSTIAGDDGIGPAVIEELRTRNLDGQAELVSLETDALGIVEYLENADTVVIIDAAQMGATPGSVLTFPAKNAKVSVQADAYSLHGLGLGYALRLAEKLGYTADVWIVGIEPVTVEPGDAMSDVVAASVKPAADAVCEMLANINLEN